MADRDDGRIQNLELVWIQPQSTVLKCYCVMGEQSLLERSLGFLPVPGASAAWEWLSWGHGSKRKNKEGDSVVLSSHFSVTGARGELEETHSCVSDAICLLNKKKDPTVIKEKHACY